MIVDWLIEGAKRTPYFHLEGYMERYWLVPYKNRKLGFGCGGVCFFQRPVAWLFQRFGIAVRIHRILRSDDDRAFHDHPWRYVSIILKGQYIEVTPVFKDGIYQGDARRVFRVGSLIFRKANSWHRLELQASETVWTLFITGPRKQSWGFMPQPHMNKVHYEEYLKNGK